MPNSWAGQGIMHSAASFPNLVALLVKILLGRRRGPLQRRGDTISEENNVRIRSKPDCARWTNKLYESSNMGAWGKAIHQEMNCGQRRPIVAIVRVRAMVGSRPPNANSDNDPSLLSLIVSVSPCPLSSSSPTPRPRSSSTSPRSYFDHVAVSTMCNDRLKGMQML